MNLDSFWLYTIIIKLIILIVKTTPMDAFHRQIQQTISNRNSKCFSNRACYNHLQPYSHDFLKAKRKAFERYKRIYPLHEKQNLYQMAKTPCLGYYVMKGYKPKHEEEKEVGQAKSSEKIISHMIKKYLHRKEQSDTQFEVLPRLEQSTQLPPGQLTSLNLKRRKNLRLFTQGEGKQNSQFRKRAPTQ